jgi:serine O-acetyltransferase
MIAPNAFVNISVPSNSLVIGNPASILHREDATDGYIDHIHKYQPAKFHTS